jgi:hypothetical protein
MNALRRQPGEQHSDQRDETNDETQPNHSFTRKCEFGERAKWTTDVRRRGNKPERDESRPAEIMKERSLLRNYTGRQGSRWPPKDFVSAEARA